MTWLVFISLLLLLLILFVFVSELPVMYILYTVPPSSSFLMILLLLLLLLLLVDVLSFWSIDDVYSWFDLLGDMVGVYFFVVVAVDFVCFC